MPFKETVIPCLDDIHETARQVGAVNTVVNSDGVLVGHNTDVTAAQWALEAVGVMVGETILVLGAGGMARAVLAALKNRSCSNIMVANRTAGRAEGFGVETVAWDERDSVPADVLINATSIGMAPGHEAMPVSAQSLSRFRAVIDVVSRPPRSRLVEQAEAEGLTAVSGDLLSLQQAMEQFTLYTGKPAPEQAMHAALQEALSAVG
jgi:shikimate dehydrogenase